MKRLLLVALMVLVTLVGMVGLSRAQFTVKDEVPASAKMYYLTVTGFTGGDAWTACDSGFHMAIISEIQDPSNLQYANRSTAAYDSLVDGQRLGPPSNHMGWVRSGVYPLSGFEYMSWVLRSEVYPLPGFEYMSWVLRSGVYPPSGSVYDCEDSWDNLDNHSGTTLSLNDWFKAEIEQTASTPNMLWQAALQFCSQPEPVWCVEDSERANVNPVIDTIIAHAFEFGD